MADEDSRRTVHAQQAFQFSDIFGFKFQNLAFGSPNARRLKLSEPEMSTDGGRKARQPIVLAPDTEGRSLVVGWIDVPRRVAELKSFNTQIQQWEARYGQERMDIARDEYDRAITELNGFFRIQQIQTTVVEAPVRPKEREKPAPPAAEKTSPIGPMIAMLVIGVLIGFGLGYLVFALRIFGSSG